MDETPLKNILLETKNFSTQLVTVYSDRAEVVKSFEVVLGKGFTDVQINCSSNYIIPESIRLEFDCRSSMCGVRIFDSVEPVYFYNYTFYLLENTLTIITLALHALYFKFFSR